LGEIDWINLNCFPPCHFVAPAMERAMVTTAKRNSELIADPSSQSARLGESHVMGITWLPSAYEAGLRSDEPQVLTVAVAARFAQW
jgi:hypothetical protein